MAVEPSTTESQAAMPAAGIRPAARRRGCRAEGPVDGVAAQRPDDPHVEDVRAHHDQPAVLEDEALHGDDTATMTSVPAHGPSRTAASTPPSRWPDVPPTTWKLNIWAAKMKAAVTPMRGIARSSKVSFVFFTATASDDDRHDPHGGGDRQRQEAVRRVHPSGPGPPPRVADPAIDANTVAPRS